MKRNQGKKKTTAAASDSANKEYAIVSAVLIEEKCNYSYEVLEGAETGIGDVHGVKGQGLILPDLTNAFKGLNVHLAAVDDVFLHAGVTVKNIDKMKNDDLAAKYSCTGFKISGSDGNRSVVLSGNKFVSVNGEIKLQTPKILLEKMSAYTWYNELNAAVTEAALEVELYKEGKCTQVLPEDFEDPEQVSMLDDDAFTKGKIKDEEEED